MFASVAILGTNLCGLNFHYLRHLSDQVLNWGPLWSLSCFHFEDVNGWVKQYGHGSGNVSHQVNIQLNTEHYAYVLP